MEIKARIKIVAAAEKKQAKKEDKVCKKARNKNQSLGIKRLALNNSQVVKVGIINTILLDSDTTPSDDLFEAFSTKVLAAAKLRNTEKKKIKDQILTGRLNL